MVRYSAVLELANSEHGSVCISVHTSLDLSVPRTRVWPAPAFGKRVFDAHAFGVVFGCVWHCQTHPTKTSHVNNNQLGVAN